MGCERVDVEARMCSSTRAALQRWIRAHFNALQMQPFISAIVSSIHITDPLLPLHDPHICKRSLASAAACSPPPHALKFAATCTDAVACARMQQQAQEAQRGFNMPVCCVAMGDGGGGEGNSCSAFSRLLCPTLAFCKPLSHVTSPTAQG